APGRAGSALPGSRGTRGTPHWKAWSSPSPPALPFTLHAGHQAAQVRGGRGQGPRPVADLMFQGRIHFTESDVVTVGHKQGVVSEASAPPGLQGDMALARPLPRPLLALRAHQGDDAHKPGPPPVKGHPL